MPYCVGNDRIGIRRSPRCLAVNNASSVPALLSRFPAAFSSGCRVAPDSHWHARHASPSEQNNCHSFSLPSTSVHNRLPVPSFNLSSRDDRCNGAAAASFATERPPCLRNSAPSSTRPEYTSSLPAVALVSQVPDRASLCRRRSGMPRPQQEASWVAIKSPSTSARARSRWALNARA